MQCRILGATGAALMLSASMANANVAVNATDFSKHAGHRHHYARNIAPSAPTSALPDPYVPPKATPDPSYYTHAGSGTAYY